MSLWLNVHEVLIACFRIFCTNERLIVYPIICYLVQNKVYSVVIKKLLIDKCGPNSVISLVHLWMNCV